MVTEYVWKERISYIFINDCHQLYPRSLSTHSKALFVCTSPSTSSLLPMWMLAAWTSSDQHSSRASLQLGNQFAGSCMDRCYHIIQFQRSLRSCADTKSLKFSHFCCSLNHSLLGWSGSKPLLPQSKKKRNQTCLGSFCRIWPFQNDHVIISFSLCSTPREYYPQIQVH